MDAQRHARIGELFRAAIERPVETRTHWLAEQTSDPVVLDRVLAMLRADEEAVPFLDEVAEQAAREAPRAPQGYRLEREIGRGGMGVVYEARQAVPSRRVAIKVLGTVTSPESESRFRREVELLGRLDHEAIARIYEAGIEDQRPFLVMELVDGVALDAHVRTMHPDREALLRLFVEICEGVAHAHARGIIHRDLKPGNIMVTRPARAKLLDFGIARSMTEDASEHALRTRTGMVLGTLPYMSPEQALGDAPTVDVRTDVHALGVILFELLEGHRPIPIEGLPLPEALERIRHQAPPPLSQVGPKGRRDLDVIIATAMAKEPARRYQTVSELAADVTRLLHDQPILARPPSAGYLLSRFVRRNRIAVASAAAALALVMTVTVAAFWLVLGSRDEERQAKDAAIRLASHNERLALEADAARNRALLDAEKARVTLRFLLDLFEDSDPLALTGQGFTARSGADGSLTARDLLDRGAERLREGLREQPATRAYLLDAIGRVYVALGYAEQGEPLLREALEIRRGLAPRDEGALAASMFHMGILSAARGEACADRLIAVLALQERIHGPQSEEVMTTLAHLAVHLAMEDRDEESDEIFPRALEAAVRLRGESSRQATLVRLFWAECLIARDRQVEGLALARTAAASIDELAGNEDFSRLLSDYVGARLARKLGQTSLAATLYERALEGCERVLGESHFLLAACLSDYGIYLKDQSAFERAVPVLERSIRIWRDRYGKDSHRLVSPLTTLARTMRSLDRSDETMRHVREIIRIAERNPHVPAAGHAVAHHILGYELYRRGAWNKAETSMLRAIDLRRKTSNAKRLELALRNLARILLARQEETILEQASSTDEPGHAEGRLLRSRSAARALALAAGLSGELGSFVRERLAAMAIADLRAARDGGLDWARQQTISEFEVLREHPDMPSSSGR